MLLDELEVALNDLIIALREAADGYDTAREMVGDESCSAFFGAARDRHRHLATSLEERLRASGRLPKGPDPELALVRDAITVVEAKLAANEVVALLEQRRADEDRIIAAARAVLPLAGADDLAGTARRSLTAAEEHARELDASIASLRRA